MRPKVGEKSAAEQSRTSHLEPGAKSRNSTIGTPQESRHGF